ncbi:glycosyltransferase family 4 protein [Neolewinella antarctica]|uniref:Glycosyltransferase involved in cell wall biosynthesis n=1 Tax=Neolewinella antarctica TaxID=442734 RepID=A0ABX0XF89_9BACT|nr:glycosyltransferase family 4 protein [Neolewinella antarctica]NJC27785.1 glycosyltransferase involved in cell wall biosynthesis [Neolewinella antarctica]
MRIAILGNYPPKACGIATFTNSLARAILANLPGEDISEFAEIVAIEDAGQQHAYPKEVTRTLPRDERAAYAALADYLNEGGFDLLVVQHEYGIFGGPDGNYLLDLASRLQVPMVMTCHTVLKDPSDGQRSVLRRLCSRADVMVVMSEMARTFLEDVYACSPDKIRVIEHGVPEIKTSPRQALRERFGWQDRRVIFTFGLLGRGKGIETVIRALPEVVAEHPSTLYVVLGKTHPNVVRESGEEYREWLHTLADELGVRDNLLMISEFASEQYLFECLTAIDVYVIPYPNVAQITSGTLAYAVGAGAAVVSTPFWHATELLAEGRGRLFPFHDSDNLSEQLLELLGDEAALATIRATALAYGEHLFWPKIGAEYIQAFDDAKTAYESAKLNPQLGKDSDVVPDLDLAHLLRMTDDCGLIQHAKFATPNRFEGYCLDDNGRALLFTCLALGSKAISHQQRKSLISLTEIYLAYIFHAQNEDGSFRNFMSYGREFLEPQGSEDSYGRALWGLAKCVAAPPRKDLGQLAQECFVRAISYLDQKTSPRTLSYGIIALSEYLGARDDENLLDLLDRSVNRLLNHYQDNRHDDWEWFEAYLTYDNALMPLALYRSLRVLPKKHVRAIARTTTDFLAKYTIINGVPRPVGCHETCHRGATPEQFDQQPLEVMAEVLLHMEAFQRSGRPADERRLRTAYSWFHGNNDLGALLYCAETAGCYDGLTEFGPNKNQGAESLLAYLVSTVAVAGMVSSQSQKTTTNKSTVGKAHGTSPARGGDRVPVLVADEQQSPSIVSATALGQYTGSLAYARLFKKGHQYPGVGE